jgi:glycosyltransferase involved in cell wall biosynthesis
MRLLLAVHGFPPIQNSGGERAAERIAYWMTAQGHDIEVFTIGRLDSSKTWVESIPQDGMIIHRLNFDIQSGENPFRNTYDNPVVGEALRGILDSRQFDLVHLVSGYLFAGQVVYTAREYGLPVVLTLTEYYYLCHRLNLMHADSSLCSGPESDEKCARCILEEKRRFRPIRRNTPALMDAYWSLTKNFGLLQTQTSQVRVRREALRRVLDAVDLVICPSHFIIEKYAEFGVDTSKFVFIQHGLNKLEFKPLQPASTDERCLRIGYTGQIKIHKGVDLLVEAAIEMLKAGDDIQVQLWGRADDQEGYASNLMLRTRPYPAIQWRGSFDGERVWDVLAGMDVLVVPSRCYENCPTVILEAYKMGIPVVATGIGGMAELAQMDGGLTFRLNDTEDLRAQLEKLRDPDFRNKLRARIPYVKTSAEEVAEIFSNYLRLINKTAIW